MSLTQGIREHVRRLRRTLRSRQGRDLRLRVDRKLAVLRLGTDYGGWSISPGHTRHDCTVLSVGVGTDISFDLEMIKRFGATIHAFDPTPKSLDWIQRQRLPPQFHFHPLGLADFDGVQSFRLARADHTSYSSALHDSSLAADEVRCPVRRLSTLAGDHGIRTLDILKLDIEGGEYTAVPDVLASGIPVGQLLLELHYDESPGQIRRALELVELVRSAGFELFARSAVGKELSFIHRSRL